jgi:threonyl-tRNA synthetase
MELSTRPENFIGSPEIWEKAEGALKKVLDDKKIVYKINTGDGAFYGPKIDFHIKDCLKRSWQCGTVQLDFSMPERFELEYTDADGTNKRPVMIHRALLGSMERFIGILLEHYGGALPLWLSPVQVSIIPISGKFIDYAREVYTLCLAAGLRVEIDDRPEKMGYKIREAEVKKIPYMAIVGEKEVPAKTVSVRGHGRGDLGSVPISQFVGQLIAETKQKNQGNV